MATYNDRPYADLWFDIFVPISKVLNPALDLNNFAINLDDYKDIIEPSNILEIQISEYILSLNRADPKFVALYNNRYNAISVTMVYENYKKEVWLHVDLENNTATFLGNECITHELLPNPKNAAVFVTPTRYVNAIIVQVLMFSHTTSQTTAPAFYLEMHLRIKKRVYK